MYDIDCRDLLLGAGGLTWMLALSCPAPYKPSRTWSYDFDRRKEGVGHFNRTLTWVFLPSLS